MPRSALAFFTILVFCVPPAYAGQVIEVKNGLLSVELKDANLGSVISGIGSKAGFLANVNPSVSARQISTSFKELSLESGIKRILTLIKCDNYFIDTDSGGNILALKVLKEGKAVQPGFRPGFMQGRNYLPPPAARPQRAFQPRPVPVQAPRAQQGAPLRKQETNLRRELPPELLQEPPIESGQFKADNSDIPTVPELKRTK